MITEFKVYEQSSYSLKRIFENIDEPEVGDYVITKIPKMKLYRPNYDEMFGKEFIDDNTLFIGKIKKIKVSNNVKLYYVYYNHEYFWTKDWWLPRSEIIDYSKSIHALRSIIDITSIYNL